MKLSMYVITIVMWVLAVSYGQAQETEVKGKIELLEAVKEKVVTEEKEALKVEVENINAMMENGAVTSAEAENRKQLAAEKRALNIENRLAIIDNKIALLERNGEELAEEDEDRVVLQIGTGDDDKSLIYIGNGNRKPKYDKRTTSDFVLAVGFNNVLVDGELGDDVYKLGGSRFAEIGWAWKTRVFKETNWLRVKYGFSFQFNGLKPKNNMVFVDDDGMTLLEEYPIDLEKSKFRMDNLVIPVHFEIGPSKKIEKDDYFRYSTHNQIKLGLGGFAGVNLGARQKLKYEVDGQDIKEKQKGNFNTNTFVYGLSAYLGWRDTAVYVKYDLSPIFENNSVEQRNISLGLRFDMD
ncbi:hypothetical protein [Constantimarinum furrinae]|uniref:Outer membrane protein beta-barrel domain-containing protein n=1 Tax=Constantimarinum furrinae TaxID=2562285 RepID=A0A7G8PRI4_9FLAO|nr:hypothetical protein [Constantimarinum furrinae]QNJ96950.1 hypothetical protein ALE3EI_0363 [Constantimarinum furrinae]